MFFAPVIDFLKNNKWLSVLALVTFLVTALGGVIVDCVAYFQPRVTILTNNIYKETVKDRTVTTIKTTTKPDGTVEKLEEVRAAIDRWTVEQVVKSDVSEPVALDGKPSLWAIHGAYAPLQRELSLGAGFQLLPSLVLGVSVPVSIFKADYSFGWATEFKPQVFATWALPRFW